MLLFAGVGSTHDCEWSLVVKNELSYSIDDLASAVGLSRWSIHDAMKKGEIPFFKIGRRTFIHRNDAKAWIKNFEVKRGRNSEAA